MTILIVLIGLLISHFATGFRHLRRFGWVGPPLLWVQGRFPTHAWLPAVVLIAATVVGSWLAIWLVTALLGLLGAFLLALVVFILTLGPRDLDHDVAVLCGGVEADQEAVASTLTAMRLEDDAPAPEGAAAVLHAGLSRWFGLLFWFVLLGITGALIYRLTRVALQLDQADPAALEWLARLRLVLDWPVLTLLTVSLALVNDLDRVLGAWRAQREQMPSWLITPSMLDRLAATLVTPDSELVEGISIGHQMVWRILVLWLVVLSILLLAGWLA
ncbi:MAG: hypothetical protein EA370_00525 [Wenzhouxiangella sp.]|nr:MAG: hypothetical protein EA370_00525 [Wenzhouxiangella sp.]